MYSNIPSGLASAMPTGELSERIRKRSSLSMRAYSMRLRSVMSVSMTMARCSSMRVALNSRTLMLPSRQEIWNTRALPRMFCGHVRLPGFERLVPVVFVGEGLEEPFLSRRDVLEGVTRDPDKLRVDVEEFTLFAEQEDAVGRFLDDGPEGLPLVLEGLFQLGDALLQGLQFLAGLFLCPVFVLDHDPSLPH